MVDHLAPVNNKVKGLLKGLRYISQIFDGEKEQEMVIGNPTDVKHVAHIGWEGPSASINEFNTSSIGQDGKEFGSAAAEVFQVEKTVEINENCSIMKDLEMLDETSPDHIEDEMDGFKIGGSNPLEQLGLCSM